MDITELKRQQSVKRHPWEIVRLKILSCCDFRESLKESAISPRAKELAGIVSRKLRRFGSQEGGFL